MTKFIILLLLAVIASALLLVSTAYDARRLFTNLHRADVRGAVWHETNHTGQRLTDRDLAAAEDWQPSSD